MGRGGQAGSEGVPASRRASMFPRETMIRYHLEHNIYPPLTLPGAVEFATKAIDAVNEGDPDRIVEVHRPDPRVAFEGRAGDVVSDWKLEDLLEGPEVTLEGPTTDAGYESPSF